MLRDGVLCLPEGVSGETVSDELRRGAAAGGARLQEISHDTMADGVWIVRDDLQARGGFPAEGIPDTSVFFDTPICREAIERINEVDARLARDEGATDVPLAL